MFDKQPIKMTPNKGNRATKSGWRSRILGPPCLAKDPFIAYHHSYQDLDLQVYEEDFEDEIYSTADIYRLNAIIELRDERAFWDTKWA